MSNTLNTKTVLSPELNFLVACCRMQPDLEEIGSQIKNEKLKIKNWQEIISLASRHGILPLVYKSLKDLPATHYPLPAEILTELKARYMSISKRNMLMSAELIRIMKLLKEHHIEALAFKGPVLAQRAYGDITLRQYGDLDILLNKKQVYQAVKLLQEYNFYSEINLKYLKDSALFDLSKDINLYNKNNNILLELHWNLFEKNLLLNLKHQFWDSNSYIQINHHKVKTLSTEPLLLYLCIHGSKHLWERIEWIVDIDRLISTSTAINWKKIMNNAQKQHSINMFLLGLSLSSEYFDTKLPERIQSEIHNNNSVKKLQKTVKYMFNTPNKNSIHTNLKRFKYYSLLHDKSSYNLTYFFHAIFDISKEDFLAVKLSKNLKLLYYLIRPIRLIYRYFLLIFQKNHFS